MNGTDTFLLKFQPLNLPTTTKKFSGLQGLQAVRNVQPAHDLYDRSYNHYFASHHHKLPPAATTPRGE